MTLELEISPEIEIQIRQNAAARSLPVNDYIARLVTQDAPATTPKVSLGEWLEMVDEFREDFGGLPEGTVENLVEEARRQEEERLLAPFYQNRDVDSSRSGRH